MREHQQRLERDLNNNNTQDMWQAIQNVIGSKSSSAPVMCELPRFSSKVSSASWTLAWLDHHMMSSTILPLPLPCSHSQSTSQHLSHSPIYTDIESKGRWLIIRSNLGFSILLKVTFDVYKGSWGIEPATFCLLDDLLHLLSYSHGRWRLLCWFLQSTTAPVVSFLLFHSAVVPCLKCADLCSKQQSSCYQYVISTATTIKTKHKTDGVSSGEEQLLH